MFQGECQHLPRFPEAFVLDEACEFLEHRVIRYDFETICDCPLKAGVV